MRHKFTERPKRKAETELSLSQMAANGFWTQRPHRPPTIPGSISISNSQRLRLRHAVSLVPPD